MNKEMMRDFEINLNEQIKYYESIKMRDASTIQTKIECNMQISNILLFQELIEILKS